MSLHQKKPWLFFLNVLGSTVCSQSRSLHIAGLDNKHLLLLQMDKFFTTWNGNKNAPSNEMLMDFHHINWQGPLLHHLQLQQVWPGLKQFRSNGSRCWKFGLSAISYNLQV